jgi:hypothetical protein
VGGMMNSDEVRYLGIALLNQEDDRDRQTQVGASDLANGCDRCVANRLLGRTIVNPRADSLWLGRELGTAIHRRYELEIQTALESERLGLRQMAASVAALRGGRSERRVAIAEIRGYGPVGGTIDVDLEDDVIDVKGSTRKKSCLMHDYMAKIRGEEPIFGRTHAQVKLSQRDYDEQMAGMVHKMDSYYSQTMEYGLGRENEGRPVSMCHILWVNRDGNGIFDVPGGQRYDDPKAVHDIWALSFPYNREAALAVVARGQRIWDALQEGVELKDIPAAPHCFPCSVELDMIKNDLDIEATLGVAA